MPTAVVPKGAAMKGQREKGGEHCFYDFILHQPDYPFTHLGRSEHSIFHAPIKCPSFKLNKIE